MNLGNVKIYKHPYKPPPAIGYKAYDVDNSLVNITINRSKNIGDGTFFIGHSFDPEFGKLRTDRPYGYGLTQKKKSEKPSVYSQVALRPRKKLSPNSAKTGVALPQNVVGLPKAVRNDCIDPREKNNYFCVCRNARDPGGYSYPIYRGDGQKITKLRCTEDLGDCKDPNSPCRKFQQGQELSAYDEYQARAQPYHGDRQKITKLRVTEDLGDCHDPKSPCSILNPDQLTNSKNTVEKFRDGQKITILRRTEDLGDCKNPRSPCARLMKETDPCMRPTPEPYHGDGQKISILRPLEDLGDCKNPKSPCYKLKQAAIEDSKPRGNPCTSVPKAVKLPNVKQPCSLAKLC